MKSKIQRIVYEQDWSDPDKMLAEIEAERAERKRLEEGANAAYERMVKRITESNVEKAAANLVSPVEGAATVAPRSRRRRLAPPASTPTPTG